MLIKLISLNSLNTISNEVARVALEVIVYDVVASGAIVDTVVALGCAARLVRWNAVLPALQGD